MTSKPLPYEHTAVTGSNRVKRGMAEVLKGGVIMDVVNVEQARIGHSKVGSASLQSAGRVNGILPAEPSFLEVRGPRPEGA